MRTYMFTFYIYTSQPVWVNSNTSSKQRYKNAEIKE